MQTMQTRGAPATAADQWVADRLQKVQAHPTWPRGIPPFVWSGPATETGKRWEGWMLRAVGAVVDEPGPWPTLDMTRQFAPDAVDPLPIFLQLWALRADAPNAPAWAELDWWPGLETPQVAFHDWGTLPANRALVLFKAAIQLLRERLPAGRKARIDLTPQEDPWREIADQAMAMMKARERRTVPQIAVYFNRSESTIEDYLADRRAELGLPSGRPRRRNNGGIP